MEFGETLEQTVRREVSEETGLIVEVGQLLFTESQTYPVGYRDDSEWHALRFVYVASVTGGNLRAEGPGETTDDAQWIALTELHHFEKAELVTRALSFGGTPVAFDHVQVAIPGGGENEARGYYGEVLGLAEIAKPPLLAARGGAWFQLGAVRIDVGIEEPFTPAKKAHPAFRVIHIEALADKLHEAGYTVRWDTDVPGVKRLYTEDPFGNRIELTEVE
jgi:catechol 2,3-dioxygenase-like lactoylglutathione lyase family enzyme